MATHRTENFTTGVIEGFYGQPWTQSERGELFDWMVRWQLNTYLYAPKDDLKHRALWREPYSASEMEMLRELIRQCKERNLKFVYGLSPGLDIRYGNDADLGHLQKRFEQMLGLGCQHFSLLFDDIPDQLHREDVQGCGSLASAQCQVANAIFRWTHQRSAEARFLFCPTAYCGRMVEGKHGGEDYLPTLGRELLPEIDVFWTGPEIVSPEISVVHIRQWRRILRRKPLLWDNLHANDYDGRRFYCGPYAGRPLELRSEVSGLLLNPNNEFPLNYVPLRTLSEFVRCPVSAGWDARKAYLSAMTQWLPQFANIGHPVTLDDLVLFGDCYYLPHEEGPEAAALYEQARGLVEREVTQWSDDEVRAFQQRATRLRRFCLRMTDLRERPLFYALSRRVWELREELDLLLDFIAFKFKSGNAGAAYKPDFLLPGMYRGGMAPKLQRLLTQQSDGTMTPAREAKAELAPPDIKQPTPCV